MNRNEHDRKAGRNGSRVGNGGNVCVDFAFLFDADQMGLFLFLYAVTIFCFEPLYFVRTLGCLPLKTKKLRKSLKEYFNNYKKVD